MRLPAAPPKHQPQPSGKSSGSSGRLPQANDGVDSDQGDNDEQRRPVRQNPERGAAVITQYEIQMPRITTTGLSSDSRFRARAFVIWSTAIRPAAMA